MVIHFLHDGNWGSPEQTRCPARLVSCTAYHIDNMYETCVHKLYVYEKEHKTYKAIIQI